MRFLFVCFIGLLLSACNEVTGNERGGIIAGMPNNFGISIAGIRMSNEDALQKANDHCTAYQKKARITSVSFGKTLFECL
jgi:hypothetical protein